MRLVYAMDKNMRAQCVVHLGYQLAACCPQAATSILKGKHDTIQDRRSFQILAAVHASSMRLFVTHMSRCYNECTTTSGQLILLTLLGHTVPEFAPSDDMIEGRAASGATAYINGSSN